MEQLQFLPFDKSMLQECVDLYQQVFSKEPWLDCDERSDVESYFINFYNLNKFAGYVLKKDDKIIALSLGFLKPWIKGEEYYIDQFCVDYSCQGKGIGSFLLNSIKNDLAQKNIHAMMLNTEKDYPSYQFYIKNGFLCFQDIRVLGCEF